MSSHILGSYVTYALHTARISYPWATGNDQLPLNTGNRTRVASDHILG